MDIEIIRQTKISSKVYQENINLVKVMVNGVSYVSLNVLETVLEYTLAYNLELDSMILHYLK